MAPIFDPKSEQSFGKDLPCKRRKEVCCWKWKKVNIIASTEKRLVHLTKSIWPKIGKNMTKKNSHQRTLRLEHDQKFILMSINLWTWLKYGCIWRKSNYFWSYSHVKVSRCCNIYYIFGHVLMLRFASVNFLVMFIKFDHIHSVILIWSSEYSSQKLN